MMDIMPDELWDKYAEEWSDTAVHNLAYVIMWAGPENFPHLHLDESPDEEFRPFFDHISEVLEEGYFRRAFEKDTPLTNRDFFEIARDANAVLGERIVAE
jgi:hypothetical protein